MTIQENIKSKEDALSDLKAHCLCLKIDGNIVYLPDGYGFDALRISETADGYKKAKDYLEAIWKRSLFWA